MLFAHFQQVAAAPLTELPRTFVSVSVKLAHPVSAVWAPCGVAVSVKLAALIVPVI
jgi:hypothetical protein